MRTARFPSSKPKLETFSNEILFFFNSNKIVFLPVFLKNRILRPLKFYFF